MGNDLPRPPNGETSDAVLLGLLAQGERHALELLFRRHNGRVFRFLARLLGGNEAVAEELVSEVFLEVWRHAGEFEARSQVSTWLLSIARHKALSVLRQRRADGLDGETAGRIEDPADNPEVALQKSQRSGILREVLDELPEAQRQVVDLVYYRERTTEDVAQSLGIPLSTVKTRMFYARKRIGELLAARGLAPAWV